MRHWDFPQVFLDCTKLIKLIITSDTPVGRNKNGFMKEKNKENVLYL